MVSWVVVTGNADSSFKEVGRFTAQDALIVTGVRILEDRVAVLATEKAVYVLVGSACDCDAFFIAEIFGVVTIQTLLVGGAFTMFALSVAVVALSVVVF